MGTAPKHKSPLSQEIQPSVDASSTSPSLSISTSTIFPLGTRASKLALIQTELVAEALKSIHSASDYEFSVSPMSVAGDRNKTSPLYLLSTAPSSTAPAKSLWTEELEEALKQGQVDMIVHSCKDVPTQLPEGCELGAILKRADPRDALVVKDGLEYKSLGEMPDGSVIGTSSVRRIAQIRKHYPKLKVMDVRGNLDTRFRKLDDPTGPYTALILAAAGINRMNLSHRITSHLSPPDLLYAVGQGAIAIEIRTDDPRVQAILKGVGDWKSEWEVGAERGLLRELEGGCSVPVGVSCTITEVTDSENSLPRPLESSPVPPTTSSPFLHHSGLGKSAALHLSACITSLNGQKQVYLDPGAVLIKSYAEAEEWGKRVARDIRSRGGKEILDEITEVRKMREEVDAKET